MGRVFANRGSIPGRVISKAQKWHLIPPCLTLSIIKCVSRVKYSNPGNRVAPSPIPRCSSYWKGSLLVAIDYGRQLYFFTYIYIYIVIHTLTFVMSQLFNEARPLRCFMLGSKPSWLDVIGTSILPHIHRHSWRKWRNLLHITSYIHVIGYLGAQFLRRTIAFHRMWQPANSPLESSNFVVGENLYIVTHRQTVSLYHNSSGWLDLQYALSWDRNPGDFTSVYIYIYIYTYIQGSINKFPDFFVWALLLIVHTWNSISLPSNLLRLQCTWCTIPTTSGRPHGSPASKLRE